MVKGIFIFDSDSEIMVDDMAPVCSRSIVVVVVPGVCLL